MSTEAGAYLRLERATRELHDIAHDKSIPKQLRIRLRHIVGDMELSEKDAYELHIAKLHAEKISSRDTLTGLPNRNAFEKALSARTNHAMRFTTDVLYAIYIDIDKFKQINDIYGHDAGDVYLKFIAEHMREVFRPDDMVARIGGDEFAALLFLRGYDDEDGVEHDTQMPALVERIRHAVYLAKCDVRDVLPKLVSGKKKPVLNVDENKDTASVGYTHFIPGADTKESLLKKADEAMYRAKKENNPA